MNKKDYIWIFNEAALGSGVNGTFSLEYHIPAAKLKVDPTNLVGSRLWLVIRNNNDSYLYAMLTPSTIELYEDGKYRDDYLLNSEAFSSVRFLPRYDSRGPWELSAFSGDEEIRSCTEAEETILRELINKNRRVGFAQPSRAVLESVPTTSYDDLEHSVPDQLASTLRTVAFGDVSQVRSFPESISAFGGVALSILKSTHPALSETEMVRLIASLDPMAKVANEPQKFRQEVGRALSSLPPIVDTFLEEIDPEKISPRKFVAHTPNLSQDWLDKTNKAEKAHESILKDVVLRMKSKGFKTKKSNSFDLFAESGDSRLLFEVKSSTEDNAVSQGEKGIIQLLRYSIALSKSSDFEGVRFLLLLQAAAQPGVIDYLSNMAKMRSGHSVFMDLNHQVFRGYNA